MYQSVTRPCTLHTTDRYGEPKPAAKYGRDLTFRLDSWRAIGHRRLSVQCAPIDYKWNVVLRPSQDYSDAAAGADRACTPRVDQPLLTRLVETRVVQQPDSRSSATKSDTRMSPSSMRQQAETITRSFMEL